MTADQTDKSACFSVSPALPAAYSFCGKIVAFRQTKRNDVNSIVKSICWHCRLFAKAKAIDSDLWTAKQADGLDGFLPAGLASDAVRQSHAITKRLPQRCCSSYHPRCVHAGPGQPARGSSRSLLRRLAKLHFGVLPTLRMACKRGITSSLFQFPSSQLSICLVQLPGTLCD